MGKWSMGERIEGLMLFFISSHLLYSQLAILLVNNPWRWETILSLLGFSIIFLDYILGVYIGAFMLWLKCMFTFILLHA